MIKKLTEFYQKHRITILRINDFLQGALIISQVLLPTGRTREIVGGLFLILYGSSTARYYIPKK